MNLSKKGIELSIVVPIYNEQENLPVLQNRLKLSAESIGVDYEIIYVNDGSADQSISIIKKFALEDQHIKYIQFSRNFGHQCAISAGIDLSSGSSVVIIDGDLQDPPELIPELYKKYKEGYHVVYAKRTERKGESFFKKTTASLFYRILQKITSIDIPIDTGDFRIVSRKVVDQLKTMQEKNKFLRGQIAWLGYQHTFVEFERQERNAGDTKFTLKKMLQFAWDGIASFSNFPLQIATMMGFFFSMVAFIVILYALYAKFMLHEAITGWTSLIISTMFIGSIQLFCIGIIGEYISRIFLEVKNRPLYIVEETNIENNTHD